MSSRRIIVMLSEDSYVEVLRFEDVDLIVVVEKPFSYYTLS
jgi:hypothetical protein